MDQAAEAFPDISNRRMCSDVHMLKEQVMSSASTMMTIRLDPQLKAKLGDCPSAPGTAGSFSLPRPRKPMWTTSWPSTRRKASPREPTGSLVQRCGERSCQSDRVVCVRKPCSGAVGGRGPCSWRHADRPSWTPPISRSCSATIARKWEKYRGGLYGGYN